MQSTGSGLGIVDIFFRFFAGAPVSPYFGGETSNAGGWDLDKLVRGPEIPLRLVPPLGLQNAQNRDLVAGLELGAAKAVLPGFERQHAALHHLESDLTEE